MNYEGARWSLLTMVVAAATLGVPSRVQAKPYKGGELYSQREYLHGRVEMRMRMARGSGLLSTFFTYKGGSESANTFWEEIDIEVFGKDDATTWQSNIITGLGSRTTSEEVHDCGVSLADAYHTYVLEWTASYVAWQVDGIEVRRTTGTQVSELTNPQSLRFNIWAANITDWVGPLDDSALPQYQYVDWISYSRYEGGQFVAEWRDDFDSFDGSRWGRADWTFAENLADFDPGNVVVQGGALVLALTREGQTGFSGTVPADSGGTACVSGGTGGSGSGTGGTGGSDLQTGGTGAGTGGASGGTGGSPSETGGADAQTGGASSGTGGDAGPGGAGGTGGVGGPATGGMGSGGTPPVCAQPLVNCGQGCADLRSDSDNCGSCGASCAADQVCNLGSCIADCSPPLTTCGQDCVDLGSSLAHCGECGATCVVTGASSECVEGVCQLQGCLAGNVDLDGVTANGCEYVCVPTGPESCNGMDDDCNGTVDDGDVCSGTPFTTNGANAADGDGCTCQAARASRSTSVGLLLGFFALAASMLRRRRNQVHVI